MISILKLVMLTLLFPAALLAEREELKGSCWMFERTGYTGKRLRSYVEFVSDKPGLDGYTEARLLNPDPGDIKQHATREGEKVRGIYYEGKVPKSGPNAPKDGTDGFLVLALHAEYDSGPRSRSRVAADVLRLNVENARSITGTWIVQIGMSFAGEDGKLYAERMDCEWAQKQNTESALGIVPKTPRPGSGTSSGIQTQSSQAQQKKSGRDEDPWADLPIAYLGGISFVAALAAWVAANRARAAGNP